MFSASSAHKPETKKAMKLNTVEGAFAVAADNLAVPYLGLFALALGATPSQIGMLTAFPNFLGNILQIPFGLWSERMHDKRILPIVGGYLSRSTWIILVFLPFLFPEQYRVPLVIVLATFRVLTANLGVPAWTALQADLVPKSIRGQYYANRNVVVNISGLLATFAATFLLRLNSPVNYWSIYALATVAGVISTFIFSRIPFNQSASRAKSISTEPLKKKIQTFLKGVKSNRDFMNYLRSSLIWNFGVTLSSSLFPVYFVEVQGGKAGSWAIFTAVNLMAMILIQRYWGRLADYFGQKAVMSVSGVGAVIIPLLWWISPSIWFPVVTHLVNGIAWGGYNLAAFNLILEITPDDSRSLYVGTFNTLMGVATALGPLVGGFAAEFFGLKPIFLASAAIRALGLFIFYLTVTNTSGRRMAIRDLLPQRKSRKTFKGA